MRPYFMQGHTRPLTHVQFNDDGDLLFTAAKDAKLQVWNTENGKRIGSYDCGKGVVWAFDVTKDSKRIVAASADMKVMVFKVETGEMLHCIPEEGPVKFVEWNKRPDLQDRFVIAHGSFGTKSQKSIKLWRLDPEGNPYRAWTQREFDCPVTRAHWGPYDQTIITCHEDGNINVWCAESGELLLEGDHGELSIGHDASCSCCAFNEDRTLMLTCSSNGSAVLWDTVGYKARKRYTTDRPLNACAISPLYKSTDNQRCHVILGGGQAAEDVTTTSASEGKFEALLYHLVFQDEIGGIKGHFGPINTIAFAPDGRGYCSGGEDGYVRLYKFDDEYFTDKFE